MVEIVLLSENWCRTHQVFKKRKTCKIGDNYFSLARINQIWKPSEILLVELETLHKIFYFVRKSVLCHKLLHYSSRKFFDSHTHARLGESQILRKDVGSEIETNQWQWLPHCYLLSAKPSWKSTPSPSPRSTPCPRLTLHQEFSSKGERENF